MGRLRFPPGGGRRERSRRWFRSSWDGGVRGPACDEGGRAPVAFGNVGAGTWFVLIAILIGKPVGILAATAVATLTGLHRPEGVTWRDLAVVGIMAGVGFTVALFFATAAFPYGRLLDETKMGALLSFSAVLIALAAAQMLGVGRFRRGEGADGVR